MKGLLLIFTLVVFTIPISSIQAQGTWSPIANFGGGAITEDRAFGIGAYGYVGTTNAGFWEYDPVTDSWTQKAAFTGAFRLSAVGFSIGTKGYFGTGGNFSDFYEYDQTTNSWAQKANFGGTGREGAVGCAIDGKGYICTGFNGTFMNDLWEYDPGTNTWTAKASLPGPTRDRPIGVAANGKGYIISGWTGSTALNDAWEYDPIADSWTAIPAFPGAPRYNSCGFAVGNKIYAGTGYAGATVADMYEYGPACAAQINIQNITCNSSCTGGATILAPLPGPGVSYAWSNGSTSASISNMCAGIYTVSVTDSAGCQSTQSILIDQPDSIEIFPTYTEPLCFGDSTGSVCLQTTGGTSPISNFVWSTGVSGNCIQGVSGGNYSVTVTDSANCSQTFPVVLNQPTPIQITFSHLDASCATCPTGVASVTIGGGNPPYLYQWSNGSNMPIQNNLLPGTYSVCVTDSNSCIQCDSVVISFTSSINIMDELNQQIQISPVPFSADLNIGILDKKIILSKVQIVDIIGKEHINIDPLESNKTYKINTEGLYAGTYIILMETNYGRFSRVIIKN